MKANEVQKIREKVEKLKSQLLRGACSSQVAMETRCKEEAYNEVLGILDTMQEEPITSVWHDKSEKPLYNKNNNALNMIAVAGVTKFSNGQEAMSIGQLLPDGKIYTPISGKEYKFEECPFTKWAYVEDLQRL